MTQTHPSDMKCCERCKVYSGETEIVNCLNPYCECHTASLPVENLDKMVRDLGERKVLEMEKTAHELLRGSAKDMHLQEKIEEYQAKLKAILQFQHGNERS